MQNDTPHTYYTVTSWNREETYLIQMLAWVEYLFQCPCPRDNKHLTTTLSVPSMSGIANNAYESLLGVTKSLANGHKQPRRYLN